jgi:hypothetical protein
MRISGNGVSAVRNVASQPAPRPITMFTVQDVGELYPTRAGGQIIMSGAFFNPDGSLWNEQRDGFDGGAYSPTILMNPEGNRFRPGGPWIEVVMEHVRGGNEARRPMTPEELTHLKAGLESWMRANPQGSELQAEGYAKVLETIDQLLP